MRAGALILGATGLLAVGAAAALFLTSVQRPQPPAAAPTETAAPPPPAPAPERAPLPQTVDFVPLTQTFTLVRDSAAYVSASLDAPQFYPLKAGTALASAARSPDGTWTVAMTADGRAAFLPSADLGPYDPSQAPQAAPPQTVSGQAEVVDTATLIVDGQTVILDGLVGSKDPYAAGMQSLINAQGPTVACTIQQSGRYICTLPNGLDVGRAALFNGAAGIANDASADYRAQADAARTGRRGMWK